MGRRRGTSESQRIEHGMFSQLEAGRNAMKILLLTITGILFAAMVVGQPTATGSDRLRTVSVALGDRVVRASVADTMASRIQGLLGWDDINEKQGMLLDFIVEGDYAIHMQGMKFPIDALWIDQAGKIVLIYHSIPPNAGQAFPSMIPSRYCLEIQAGFCRKYGIKVGRKVKFGEVR
jgi:uncharacterized protein